MGVPPSHRQEARGQETITLSVGPGLAAVCPKGERLGPSELLLPPGASDDLAQCLPHPHPQ